MNGIICAVTRYVAPRNNNAFTTSPKSPKVRILIGIERIERIGLMKILIRPNTRPNTSAVFQAEIPIAGIKCVASIAAAASTIHFKIIFNINI